MSLLNEDLTLWEIAHRWNNYDPNKFRITGIPIEVKDSIRLMMDAILSERLVSITISTEKRPRDSDMPREYFIRTYIDDFNLCIQDLKYNKKLFIFIVIDRSHFQDWCERFRIPLPEFWFPKGWEHADIAPSYTGIPTAQKSASRSISEIAKKAAQKRHEPLNKLKQEFFAFWGQGRFKSRADAARRFHKSLPPEKQKRFISESAAVRTLTQALGKHLRAKDK